MTIAIELLGWTGTLLIVGAFFLVSRGKVDPKGRTYLLMNLAGSLGVGIDVYTDRSWPALTLQVVWILIALTGILGTAKKKSAEGTAERS